MDDIRTSVKKPTFVELVQIPGSREQVISIGVVVLILLVLGVFFVSLKSIPGDFLYGTKTGFEAVVRTFAFSPERKAEYEAAQIEKRLGEVAELHQREEVSEDALDALLETIEGHSARFSGLVPPHREGIELTRALDLQNHFAGALLAIEMYTEKDQKFATLEEGIEDVRRNAVNGLGDTAELFVAGSEDTVIREYLITELGRVSQGMADNPPSSSARLDIEDAFGRAIVALQGMRPARALELIASAERTLYVEGKLEGVEFERTPGAPQTATSTTATST